MAFQPKSYQKFTATAATAVLVATAVTPAMAAASFSDVSGRYKEAVDYLVDHKITNGINSTQFGTAKEIKRVDVASMVAKAVLTEEQINNAKDSGFTDVPGRAKSYVDALKEQNIINGKTATSFGSDASITRGEAALMLAKAYKVKGNTANVKFSDVSSRYTEAVAALVDNKITSGKANNKFGTSDPITRGELAIFLYKLETLNDENPAAPEVVEISALSNKEIKVTGSALDQLKSENFNLEGNNVVAYKVSENKSSATITFEKPFELDKELKLNFIEKVEGAADKVTQFPFTYSLKVTSVAVADVRLDAVKDKQYLSFTINNGAGAADIEQLKQAGYTVEFQATASVLADASTGEIDEAKIKEGDTFKYKVILKKGDTKVESELKEAKVLNFDQYVSSIEETGVSQGAVTVKSSKISVQDGAAQLTAGKVTSLSGATIAIPKLTYKSSNPTVATIDGDGKITPIKPGAVVFTITADAAKVEVPLTVVSGARTAATAASSVSSVKLYNENSDTVSLTVSDQYGDEYEGKLNISSKNPEIAAAENPTISAKDGKAEFKVVSKASAKGDTTLEIKDANNAQVLKTVAVSISDDNKVASRKLETANSTDDLKLDVAFGSGDNQVNLVWNTYNQGGFKIGSEALAGGAYSVSSSDEDVASVAVNEDKKTVTVTGKKAGTAQIIVKEGTVTRETVTITVTDSTPVIKSVKFEEVKDITKAGALTEVVVLKPENVTLSNGELMPQIDTNGDIFVDLNKNKKKDNEEVLGKLTVSYSGKSSDFSVAPAISSGMVAGTIANGAEGTLVVYVTPKDEKVALATSSINVKVN
ncbi:S-layer homology domain-containing protein [Pseudobacillus sp. 179-B 2D1 NHS]|uniref:S-layer homology domain-containing protein n=1 Tax=Pseudobacillus sp. 179-B 2D1 NHS TaxID=3374292 RepID=UPI00387A2F6B